MAIGGALWKADTDDVCERAWKTSHGCPLPGRGKEARASVKLEVGVATDPRRVYVR